jgi:hypothetical protein
MYSEILHNLQHVIPLLLGQWGHLCLMINSCCFEILILVLYNATNKDNTREKKSEQIGVNPPSPLALYKYLKAKKR